MTSAFLITGKPVISSPLKGGGVGPVPRAAFVIIRRSTSNLG